MARMGYCINSVIVFLILLFAIETWTWTPVTHSVGGPEDREGEEREEEG